MSAIFKISAKIVSSVSSMDSKAYKTTLQDYIIHYGGDRVNPLSPNIHIQILQTDLHTFPYRIS